MIDIDIKDIEEIKRKYVAFDTETTGLNPNRDKMVEIAALCFKEGQRSKTFSSLIKSTVRISEGATRVNGIRDKDLVNARREKDVILSFLSFCEKCGRPIFVAHNAIFDMKFLARALSKIAYCGTLRYVDTCYLARKCISLQSYKLESVAAYFGIQCSIYHRALGDAAVAGEIFFRLLTIAEEKGINIRLEEMLL